jgi:hypothetical protein
MSARKGCSENASAGVAGGAEEKNFHNRTSSMTTQATRRESRHSSNSGTWPNTFGVVAPVA